MNLIDKKKLRAAINEVSRNRKNPNPPKVTLVWSPGMTAEDSKRMGEQYSAFYKYQKENSAERATLLCSLMAASRGKLHVQKEWVPTYQSDGSQKLVTRTLEDQEKLVAGVAKEFEAEIAYVVYEVCGFPGPKMAGPYKASDVQAQYEDIRGFEGVFNARITTSLPPSLRPSEPASGVPTDAPAPVAPSAA